MKTKTFVYSFAILAFSLMMMSFTPSTKKNIKNRKTVETEKLYKKKYTNADFYTDGVFNKDIALKAYLDMFQFYGIPYTDMMKKEMWVTDFGLGDFENVGMAGIFWINDAEHNYFGHEIYLLPNQMIVEHAHVPTSGHPAKAESWLVRNGSCYNFSVGEATPNGPKLPESQKNYITAKHYSTMKVGDIESLGKLESKHFLLAGNQGLVVTEFASYHDGNGLRFTNPGVKL